MALEEFRYDFIKANFRLGLRIGSAQWDVKRNYNILGSPLDGTHYKVWLAEVGNGISVSNMAKKRAITEMGAPDWPLAYARGPVMGVAGPRFPKIPVPTRINVAPSSMATSKSEDIPIDNSVRTRLGFSAFHWAPIVRSWRK